VWPGISPTQIGLDGVGGGSGYVNNVTYYSMQNENNAWDIELTQCYGAVSTAACADYPVGLLPTVNQNNANS
jgi:galacturan 1,4-alpha-galacturonidase